MKVVEFLAVISIAPSAGFEVASREQVLGIYNNFIIFNPQLDIFRFAYLSVREFLEKQPIYAIEAINTLVAENCLLNLVPRNFAAIIKECDYQCSHQ
jgi:hypothetical protein